MTNVEIAETVASWYGVFACVFQTAERDAKAAVAMMGNPRRTERANIFHLCIREGMRALAEKHDPLLTLVEEPEGQGLDYVVLEVGEQRIAIRWAKYDGVRINRNSTHRQTGIQQQGCFPFYMETDAELQTVTIGYVLEDDFTEGGRPCWWMCRLALLRESTVDSEFIHDVATFTRPDSTTERIEQPSPRIVLRDDERRRMVELADDVVRKIG